jgi:hypothetical protein
MKAAITRFRITLSMWIVQRNHREPAVARKGGVASIRTAASKKSFTAGRGICGEMGCGMAPMITLTTQPKAALTAEAEHPRFP